MSFVAVDDFGSRYGIGFKELVPAFSGVSDAGTTAGGLVKPSLATMKAFSDAYAESMELRKQDSIPRPDPRLLGRPQGRQWIQESAQALATQM